jgi:hypothetical protein
LPLAEQIPALVEHNLDPSESVAIGISRGSVRFPFEKFMLLARELIDIVSDLLVVHTVSYVRSRVEAIVLSSLRTFREADAVMAIFNEDALRVALLRDWRGIIPKPLASISRATND